MDNRELILKQAYEYGKKHHPDASSSHHAAFANSVAYAMTGISGGYGGPSMREHLASQLIINEFGSEAERCTFEQAVQLLDRCCYGELTINHALILHDEYCYDDAPSEMEVAPGLLAAM